MQLINKTSLVVHASMNQINFWPIRHERWVVSDNHSTPCFLGLNAGSVVVPHQQTSDNAAGWKQRPGLTGCAWKSVTGWTDQANVGWIYVIDIAQAVQIDGW